MILIFVTKGDSIGGAQVFVKDLAKVLKENEKCVAVCSGAGNQFSAILKHEKIKHLQINKVESFFGVILGLFKFFKIIKNNQISRIYANSTYAIIYARLCKLIFKGLDIRIIHHGLYYRSTNNRVVLSFVRLFELLTYKIVDYTYFVSKTDETNYKKFLNVDFQSRVIYNGIEPISNFKKPTINKIFKVVTIARHSNQKDYKGMFKAIQNINNLELISIGDGPLFNQNKELVKKMKIENKVKLIGYNQNPSDFLKTANAFLLLSNWEGLPISIIEAMNHGLPIIASEVGGVGELISNGLNGYLVSSWIEAKTKLELIQNSSEIDYYNMSTKSREVFLEKFNSEKNYLGYI